MNSCSDHSIIFHIFLGSPHRRIPELFFVQKNSERINRAETLGNNLNTVFWTIFIILNFKLSHGWFLRKWEIFTDWLLRVLFRSSGIELDYCYFDTASATPLRCQGLHIFNVFCLISKIHSYFEAWIMP